MWQAVAVAFPARDDAELTTERIDPSFYLSNRVDAFLYACHLATYDFARQHVEGRSVLDFGCGIGYGTHRIAEGCTRIVGVDVSGDAIAEAVRRFRAPNLSYRRIEPAEEAPLPFEDGEFDVVLSFQVFEHLPDPDAYLREARRVLAPDGLFICVTPERGTRLFRWQRPWNEFHLEEYSQDQLAAHLSRHFGSVEVAGMSARPDLAELEMARVRKLRRSTVPFTFRGVPEPMRVKGLRLLKKMNGRRSGGSEGPSRKSLEEWAVDPRDVEVFSRTTPSLNVVALARQPV